VLHEPAAAEIIKPALRLIKAAVKTIVHAHADPGVVGEIRALLEDTRRQIEALGRTTR
jgi:hypothetical protein